MWDHRGSMSFVFEMGGGGRWVDGLGVRRCWVRSVGVKGTF